MEPERSVKLNSFSPIYDVNSRILILGTMPSPASLRAGMNYAHPQNAFWRLLADITGDETGVTSDERRNFLHRHHIALWDTLKSCTRPGAADSDIRTAVPNDVAGLTARCPQIAAVFLNGSAALRFYRKYHASEIALPYFGLPSTSPANARGGYSAKRTAWQAISAFLG